MKLMSLCLLVGGRDLDAMYGLPKSFDPSFLLARPVEEVTFTAFQVNVYFHGKVWIQIEGRYCLFERGELIESVTGFPLQSSSLLRLLGKKGVAVSFEAETGNLEIHFEDGYTLSITGDVGPYEAYRMSDGSTELVV